MFEELSVRPEIGSPEGLTDFEAFITATPPVTPL